MKAQMFNYNFWVDCTDPKELAKKYRKLLKESGFKILKTIHHHFQPYGYTALFLLSESHLAIHTFPEENKTYIELSSCVEKYYDNFKELIK